ELQEEDGGAAGRISISESLQDLVARLAAQLHDEATAKVETIHSQALLKEREQAEEVNGLQREITLLTQQLEQAASALHTEQATHAKTREAWQQETVTRH